MTTVANQPKTPHRTVRVPDEVWLPAKVKAESEGSDLSKKIREWLTDYVKDANMREPYLVDLEPVSALTYELIEGVHFERDGARVVLIKLPDGITHVGV